MLKNRNLFAPTDFTVAELEELIQLANDIMSRPQHYAHICDGKLMASLFYEPSTRTKFSFDSAMYRLGGNVIGFSDPSTTSSSKGESLSDSAKIFSQYVDIIVMRHPKPGTPQEFAKSALCPVVNAGDGGNQHPTQTLADLLTISRCKGGFENLTVALCGDLKYGRTIHSLTSALSRYTNVEFIFISPKELEMPDYIIDDLKNKGIAFSITNNLEESIPKADVLYMSRVQRERFENAADYERLKDCFILTRDKLVHAKSDMVILHPLPRVNEIAPDVDEDPRAKYFEQAKNGMFIRMALIIKLLGVDENL